MNEETKKRIADINKGIIPEGYKKTKVGIVPVEWEVVRLKSISKHSTEKNKDLKYHETYTNSATQGIIRQTDYFDKQISNNENIDGYYVVKQNDYVYNPRISVSAPCGPIRKSHFAETGVMSPLYTVFRLNDEYEDNEYIEHYLYSPFWHRYMSSVANYGARHDRMNITNEDLFNMPIPFPPLPEQQKIAEILSTQDKLIELQEKKIEKLKELKKAYLQKMFPKKGSKYPELRFKGFTDAWEQRKLSDILERRVEHRQQSKEYPRLAFASGQGVIPLSERKTNNREQLTKDEFTKNYLVTELDDIVYNPANVKYGAIDRNKYGRGLISPIYVTFTTTEKPGFVERIVSSHDFQQRALKFEEGTVIKRQSVNPNDFVALKILLSPYREEQEKISDFFDNLDSLIIIHQRKLELQKQKKKALMQLLLTGKVRVIP